MKSRHMIHTLSILKNIEQKKDKIFSYMNFDKLDEYVK